ncbi:MAG: TetR/AcrR family transcriptional regulator [Candidatus Delongbacteria bacterium]|nr:TetR/AcrR family transcriptional regulator [Candidatus Delongbacteria bacterium]MBN2833493.1 TetR/AcrR family transcriptional regulator [Candidatus Delongbacteria bacterium]
MSPRDKSKNDEIRQRSMKMIENAAIKLFAYNGFDGTSIDRISKEAGVSKGLIYNYYDSKEELLKSIIVRGFESYIYLFKEISIIEDPIYALEILLTKSIIIYKENKDMLNIYYSLVLQEKSRIIAGEKISEVMEYSFSLISNIFIKLGAEDVDTEVRIIAALMDGVAIQVMIEGEKVPFEKIFNRYIQNIKTRFGK